MDGIAQIEPPLQRRLRLRSVAPPDSAQLRAVALVSIAYGILFYEPFLTLLRDWWRLPEAGHGILLAPIAVWLARKSGRHPQSMSHAMLGLAVLVFAVLMRYAGGLAAELFTTRLSMLVALAGLTLYFAGVRQLIHWWLPFALLLLAIPLPELVTQTLALPLQFKASQMGASLLEMRNVPVQLTGNIIRVPGHELFVTEACSGLRSMTALLSTAVLLSAMCLRTPVARAALMLLALPIAIVVNGIRVFLTGFLVYFVGPAAGTGFMHATEGLLLFIVSLAALGLATAAGIAAERTFARVRAHA